MAGSKKKKKFPKKKLPPKLQNIDSDTINTRTAQKGSVKKMEHTITMDEIRKKISNGVTSFMKKDNSPRGCTCIPAKDVRPGDEIVINNHFTRITETE